MIKKIFYALLFLGASATMHAQKMGPELFIYPELRTFLLHPAGQAQSLAVAPLGEVGALSLQFDDVSANTQALNYTWVHCNRNWNPSPLLSTEYLEGFLEGQLHQGTLSFNTYLPYSHFSDQLPHANCMPRISGNYYLLIYEQDPNDYLVKYPVVFYENAAGIQSSIHRTADVSLTKTHQEIDALVDLSGFSVQNPFSDVQLSLVQNRNWASLRTLAPRYLRNGSYDFDYNNGENAFPGTNIFRFLDSKNIPVPTLRIPKYELQDLWRAFILPDKPRGIDPFVNQDDARGAYVPRKQGASPSTEADYIWLDFWVEDLERSGQRNLFVVGDFNQYRQAEEYQLVYDEKEQAYRGSVLVKQGYLEYHLAEWDAETQRWDLQYTEANHWNCPNDYTAILYLREWGQRYDRVIGYSPLRTDGILGLNIQISTP